MRFTFFSGTLARADGGPVKGGRVILRPFQMRRQRCLSLGRESLVIGCQAPIPRVGVLAAVTVLSFDLSFTTDRPNSLVLATAAATQKNYS